MPLVTVSATDTAVTADALIGGAPGMLQAVPKFPLSLAATEDLFNFANTFPSLTPATLNANISATVQTIVLAAGTGAQLPPDTFEVSIDDEIIFVLYRTGDTLYNCIRGAEQSTAATHGAGANVQQLITALSHNQVAAEIIELEQLIGARGGNLTQLAAPIELAIPSTVNGNFSLAHGLPRAPSRAIPVSDSDGVIRLQNPVRFDATYVYLNASTSGLT